MKLRKLSLPCLLLAMAALTACSGGSGDDENASIVNIEKGVVPEVAIPEATDSQRPADNTADIMATTEDSEKAVASAENQVDAELPDIEGDRQQAEE